MNDEDLQRQAKQHFDDSVDRLDGETLSRLNQGRHAALAAAASPASAWLRYAPAGGLAAAAMIAYLVTRFDTSLHFGAVFAVVVIAWLLVGLSTLADE